MLDFQKLQGLHESAVQKPSGSVTPISHGIPERLLRTISFFSETPKLSRKQHIKRKIFPTLRYSWESVKEIFKGLADSEALKM